MPLIPDQPHAASSSAMIPDAAASQAYLLHPPPLADDPTPAPPRLSLRRARDVARALESERAQADGEYRLALLKSYIDFKLTYHAHAGLRRKLRPLERAFPQYRATFSAARAFYCLPPVAEPQEAHQHDHHQHHHATGLPGLISTATSLFHTSPVSTPKSPRPSYDYDLPPAYSEEPLAHDAHDAHDAAVIGELRRMVEVERAARCAAEQRLAAVSSA